MKIFTALPAIMLSVGLAYPDPGIADVMKQADELFWLDNWVSARPLFIQVEEAASRTGDVRDALYARLSRLRADAERESYAQVLDSLRTEEQNPLLGDPVIRLRYYVVRGSVNMSLNPDVAKLDWQLALEAAKSIGSEAWQGRAKGELSICSFLEGDYATAKDLSDEALRIASATADVAGEIRQRSLKGVALLEQRRYDEADVLVKKAITLADHTPKIRFPIMAYMAESEILTLKGRTAESEALLARVEKYLSETAAAVYLPDFYLELAQRTIRRGDLPKGIRLYESAARSAAQVRMPRPYSAAHFNLARLDHEAGKDVSAQHHIEQALSASEQLSDRFVIPHQLALAAEISSALQDTTKAVAYYERAHDVIEALLTRTQSPGVRAALIAAFSAVYFGNFRLAVQNNEPAKAFTILERAKGRVINEMLYSSGVRQNDRNSAASSATDIVAIQTALMQVKTPNRRKRLLDQLFEAELRLHAPVSLADAKANPVEIKALQRVLRDDEAVLEYALGNPVSYCVVITKTGMTIERLGPAHAIAGAAQRFLTAVKRNDDSTLPAVSSNGSDLASMLLEPIQAVRSKPRLIIIPDQVISTLPFDPLVGRDGRMLIESKTIAYEPSSTALYLLRTRAKRVTRTTKLLAVAASSASGSVLLPSAVKLGAQSNTGQVQTRGLFDVEGGQFTNLPFTGDEVAMLSRVVRATVTVLGSSNATEAAFKRQNLNSFRILHLAMHGVADRTFPERSALVFNNIAGTGEDGLLQPREIISLPIRADLVTLSACDTAVGKIEGIEGVASLVRAFLLAGARGVVATLWKADDRFTATLMTRFYTELSNGIDVATALRIAKLDLIHQYGDRARPYYWAGFTFTGDSVQVMSHSL